MKKFNFMNRKEVYDSLKVNPNLEIKKVKYGDFEYLSVENFFYKNGKIVYPALDGGVATFKTKLKWILLLFYKHIKKL